MLNRRRVLIAAASKSKGHNLPAEYQQVEYIESTGTQYIRTKIPAQSNGTYYIDFQFPQKKTTYVFGVYAADKHMITINSSSNDLRFIWNGHILDSTQGYPVLDLNRHTIQFKNGEHKFDNDLFSTQTGTFNSGAYYIYMFGLNYWNTPSLVGQVRIYHCLIELGNNSYNFIPCYRKVDDVAGMYDTFNGVFYTNSGTGNFIVGPDVN